MLYTKDSLVGIDEPIQEAQEMLFTKLCAKWGLSEEDYKCYGRVYKTQVKDGYLPQGYISGKEYQNLFLDDKVSATSFFGCNNFRNENGMIHADVHLIFSVNLTELGYDVEHIPDEEVRMDVYRLFERNSMFQYNETVIEIDNVFREYTAWKKLIPNRDMMPFHFFRLNFTVKYIPNNIC